ncbi:MAG: hypothetical protein Kow0089_00380 [Desulfobulbaceae bacterium]
MKRLRTSLSLLADWKTGRWFLLGTTLFLLVSLATPDLVLRLIVAPRGDDARHGWWMRFSEPSRPVGVDGYRAFLEAAPLVALNPDFRRARGYMLWSIQDDGQYRLQFLAEDHGTLSVDGRLIARLAPGHPEGERIETWVGLKRGPHLLEVDLRNDSGRGGFTIEVVVPPKMSTRHLLGPDVTAPVLTLPELWWALMECSGAARWIAWPLFVLSLLCLLLPLTLRGRIVAVPVTAAVILAPALSIPVKVEREPYIGDMVAQELRRENPDFVFIGNSMLWSRIEDAHLEKLLGGQKVHSIVNFGGLSAVHYLAFKYLFLPADIHPKRVFIFFRGLQFTFPRARTSNDPFVEKIIERLTPAPDPVFEEIVHGRSRTLTDKVYDGLLRLFPVAAAEDRVRRSISDLAAAMAKGWNTENRETKKLLDGINKRFSLESGSLRAGVGTESLEQEKVDNPFDFYGRVENSFLPHILQLAKEHDIRLAFIRVQERPPADGPPEDPPEMKRYMADMRRYLEEHGAALYDFTGDPELPLSAYHDGDHIKDQKKYTELFYRRVGHLLK